MVKPGYLCEICKYSGSSEPETKEHEKIPITGPDLKEGDLIKLKLFSPDNSLLFGLVDVGPYISNRHERSYVFSCYSFKNSKSKRDDSLISSVAIKKGDRLSEVLEELTETEFKDIITSFEDPEFKEDKEWIYSVTEGKFSIGKLK
jgi:hypothetical protein